MGKRPKRQYTLEELYNPQIDIRRDAYLYGRQSGKDQVIQNIQSHISQTVELIAYTKREIGYRDDGTTGKVTLLVENEAVDADSNISIKDASGTWPIDKRRRLKEICDAIENGTDDGRTVGVVIAEFVDRLFRDEDRIDSNVFIKICRENDCFVHIASKRMTTHRIRLVRYSQRVNRSDREPLISFTSSRPDVSISFGKNRTWYHYKARSYNGMTRETLLSADADTVESAVVKKLFAKLQYVDIGDLEQKRKAMLAEKANRVKKLERDIEAIDEEVETLTENMRKIKTDAVVKRLEAQIAKLLERRAEAEEEITQITKAYQDITLGTLEEELKDLEQFWKDRSFSLRKSLLRLLIKEATLDYISPRFYRISIEWVYGDWGNEVAIIDKGKANKEWDEEENTILRTLYTDHGSPSDLGNFEL